MHPNFKSQIYLAPRISDNYGPQLHGTCWLVITFTKERIGESNGLSKSIEFQIITKNTI